MVKEFILNHVFMSSILLVGVVSLLLQAIMTLSLKGYVKASANMKTTKKKVMLNLKNQFETIYGMNYQVRNTAAYVDKYLLKFRFVGFSFSSWEKLPFLSAGIVTLLTVSGIFYGYIKKVKSMEQFEILFAYGIVLACLFIFFHIFGIKSKKQQMQIQLVDYLENYLANRLIRTKEGKKELRLLDEDVENAFMENSAGKKSAEQTVNMEEDMEMLKRLIREVETGKDNNDKKKPTQDGVHRQEGSDKKETGNNEADSGQEVAIAKEGEPGEAEIELLEEFVQSFFA